MFLLLHCNNKTFPNKSVFSEVESYSPVNDQWTLCPSLSQKKGSLAAATVNDKIFAMGGGNGKECFSDVEMLDLDMGRWILTRSMLQKVYHVFFFLDAMEEVS